MMRQVLQLAKLLAQQNEIESVDPQSTTDGREPAASQSRPWVMTMAANRNEGQTLRYSFQTKYPVILVFEVLEGTMACNGQVNYIKLTYYIFIIPQKQHVLFCFLAFYGTSATNTSPLNSSWQNSMQLIRFSVDITIKPSQSTHLLFSGLLKQIIIVTHSMPEWLLYVLCCGSHQENHEKKMSQITALQKYFSIQRRLKIRINDDICMQESYI